MVEMSIARDMHNVGLFEKLSEEEKKLLGKLTADEQAMVRRYMLQNKLDDALEATRDYLAAKTRPEPVAVVQPRQEAVAEPVEEKAEDPQTAGQKASKPDWTSRAWSGVAQFTQQGPLGLPLWIFLIGAFLLVTFAGRVLTQGIGDGVDLPQATPETGFVFTTPDQEGLLTVGGVTLPVKVEAVPRLPFVGMPLGSIAIGVMVFILALPLVWLDNAQPRPNQAPARRANAGIVVFFLSVFLPGWWAFAGAVTGVLLARRPRSGAQMQTRPFLIGMALFLYLWFDIVAPLIPTFLAQLGVVAPWAVDLIRFIFSEDNLRPLAMVAFVIGFVSTMFRKDFDQTTQIWQGLAILAWWVGFGVFPYFEDLPVLYHSVAFWVMFALLAIGMMLEHWEAETTAVTGFVVALIAIVFLASAGVRSLVTTTPGGLIWYLTTPLVATFLLIILIAWAVGQSMQKKGGAGEFLARVLSMWGGQMVFVGPLAVPIDAVITVVMLFFGLIMLGVNVFI